MLVEKKIEEITVNPYTLFSKKWAALSVGNEQDGYNAMTIAWGTIGALWEKTNHRNQLPAMTVFVRPGRYTNVLMKREEYFTVAVFDESYKKTLGYLGSHTGKNTDKYKEAGITPVFDKGTVYPKEAELVFACRKLYASSLQETEFCDKELISFNYPEKDFHHVYVGQIEKILKKE